MLIAKSFTTTVVHDGPGCYFIAPFDPKVVFGKLRAPVKVTINGFTYRSTIAAMGGQALIPLRKSHRWAAGVDGRETVRVRLELDAEPRVVTAPADFLRAVKAVPGALARWKSLSYSHQREHVEAIEEAKRPETRARRIAAAVTKLG